MRVLVACIFAGLLVVSPNGQTKQKDQLRDNVLRRPVRGDELKHLSTPDAFYSSLNRAGAPGGMVRILNCRTDNFKQAWRPQNSPLSYVVNALVSADPRYRWEVEGGVVNLLPATGEPALLQTRINKFSVKDVLSASVALDRLLALPEVIKRMHKLHLEPGLALVNDLSGPHPRRFSVSRDGGTLRQALNAIAREQGLEVWQYVETHCGGRNEVVVRF